MESVSKLYVGNLNFKTTEEELKKHFEEKGVQVKSVNLIKDKYTGRAKGFGFIEVESEDAIDKAVEALDGQELAGRKLTVNKARPPKERPAGGGRFNGDSRGRF